MPEVKVVTSLILRRQTRRRWESTTLEGLFHLLPSLQELRYEPWREWDRVDQRITDRDNHLLFESLIANRLRQVVIFEDYNDLYTAINQRTHKLNDEDCVRIADRAVTRALAEASLTLERLSAAFIVDATWFLDARQPDWVWQELDSLTLTSAQLVPNGNFAAINDMLQTAAEAVKKMPKLRSMKLWNGGRGFASVFRYRAFEFSRPARITWRANWHLTLEPKVTRGWEAVAQKHAPCGLEVNKELLGDGTLIKSHGDAIQFLEFSHQVVCPISLDQIQLEKCL